MQRYTVINREMALLLQSLQHRGQGCALRLAPSFQCRLFADAAQQPEAASTSGRPHAQAAQQHGGVAAAGNSMGAQPQQASSRPQGPSSGATAKEQTSYPIRLTGLSPTTTRRDVARLFAGFSITEYNIKPEFEQPSLRTVAFWALFPAEHERQRALALHKHFVGAAQAFMRPVESQRYMHMALMCPLAMNSRGRYLLVDGIEPQNSLSTVVRHFEGFQLARHAATMITQGERRNTNEYELMDPQARAEVAQRRPPLRAIVRFVSAEEASRALRARNHSWLGNDTVSMRILP